jgi:hypothetical protein
MVAAVLGCMGGDVVGVWWGCADGVFLIREVRQQGHKSHCALLPRSCGGIDAQKMRGYAILHHSHGY